MAGLKHEGIYTARSGQRIPYIMGMDDGKMIIVYDAPEGKQIIRIPLIFCNGYVWKVNKKSVSCRSAADLFRLFNEEPVSKYNAYATATFRHFTGIK